MVESMRASSNEYTEGEIKATSDHLDVKFKMKLDSHSHIRLLLELD